MLRPPDAEVQAAADVLSGRWLRAEVAVVLGSGLGRCLPELGEREELAYGELPGLGPCAVPGHDGVLVTGLLGDARLLVFRGRHHLYEGLSMARVAFPVRLAAHLGARVVLLFSAVGAVDSELPVGSWLFVEDHINLTGRNPLEGVADENGPPFVDLTRTYRTDLYPQLAAAAGLESGLARGVLAMFPGPSYETPAEVRMVGALGARVVSMSTVPEAVWARHLGLDVIALAHVANPAAGVGGHPLSHREVMDRAAVGAEQVPGLIAGAVAAWQRNPGRSPLCE